MTYKILPYKKGSAGAKVLADSIGGLRLKTEGKLYKQREKDVLINWGSSTRPERFEGTAMLNAPEVIAKVTDKLEFFQHMRETDAEIVPRFWTSKEDIWEGDFPIVCRTILNGHSGAGIVIAKNRSELVDAPLYVEYIKKQQEYRVHVGRAATGWDLVETIAIQQKKRLKSVPNDQVNWEVRNHDNGFVFARQDVNPSIKVTDAARRALVACGMDFGAVDVVYNEKKDEAYVLEINSAPGLEGQTVMDYADFFKNEKGITGGGIIPKARVGRNDDGTWHVEAPYLDEYGRRKYVLEDCNTFAEALSLARV